MVEPAVRVGVGGLGCAWQLSEGLGVPWCAGTGVDVLVAYQVVECVEAGVGAVDCIALVLGDVVAGATGGLEVRRARERRRGVDGGSWVPVAHARFEGGAIEVVEILQVLQVL